MNVHPSMAQNRALERAAVMSIQLAQLGEIALGPRYEYETDTEILSKLKKFMERVPECNQFIDRPSAVTPR